MRIANVQVKVFKFDELSEKAKNKVITNYIECELELNPDENLLNENWRNSIKRCKRLQTTWFLISEIYCEDKENIDVILNESEYLENGSMFVENEVKL